MTNPTNLGSYPVVPPTQASSIGPYQVEVRPKKGLFGGRRGPTPVLDRKTKRILPSKSEVGRLYHKEYNLPYTGFVYYTLVRIARDRQGLCRFLDAVQEQDGSWVFQDPITLQKIPLEDSRLEWSE